MATENSVALDKEGLATSAGSFTVYNFNSRGILPELTP